MIKLGVKVMDGVLVPIIASTGEEIYGVRFVSAGSGVDEATTMLMDVFVFDEHGNNGLPPVQDVGKQI